MGKIIEVSDDSGCPMSMLDIKGLYFLPFIQEDRSYVTEETLSGLKDLKIRRDDVLLCSFPKSGTHWLGEILRMLLQGTTAVIGGEIDAKLPEYFLEMNMVKDLEKLPSPRVLFTHLPIDSFPQELLDQKPKIINVYRNPKDVSVSHYSNMIRMGTGDKRVYTGTFGDYLKLFVNGQIPGGSWFEYNRQFSNFINSKSGDVLRISYEHMKKNCEREIMKVSEFLGLSTSEEFVKQVAQITQFDKMKDRNGPSFFSNVDNKSLFYRKGEIGDWKNWYTVAKNEWFDEIIQQKIGNLDLQFIYS